MPERAFQPVDELSCLPYRRKSGGGGNVGCCCSSCKLTPEVGHGPLLRGIDHGSLFCIELLLEPNRNAVGQRGMTNFVTRDDAHGPAELRIACLSRLPRSNERTKGLTHAPLHAVLDGDLQKRSLGAPTHSDLGGNRTAPASQRAHDARVAHFVGRGTTRGEA